MKRKPRLRVYRGGWDNAVREEAGAELVALETEARAHCARMRLALQRSFWDEEPFAAVRRTLLGEVDRYDRKFASDDAA